MIDYGSVLQRGDLQFFFVFVNNGDNLRFTFPASGLQLVQSDSQHITQYGFAGIKSVLRLPEVIGFGIVITSYAISFTRGSG